MAESSHIVKRYYLEGMTLTEDEMTSAGWKKVENCEIHPHNICWTLLRCPERGGSDHFPQAIKAFSKLLGSGFVLPACKHCAQEGKEYCFPLGGETTWHWEPDSPGIKRVYEGAISLFYLNSRKELDFYQLNEDNFPKLKVREMIHTESKGKRRHLELESVKMETEKKKRKKDEEYQSQSIPDDDDKEEEAKQFSDRSSNKESTLSLIDSHDYDQGMSDKDALSWTDRTENDTANEVPLHSRSSIAAAATIGYEPSEATTRLKEWVNLIDKEEDTNTCVEGEKDSCLIEVRSTGSYVTQEEVNESIRSNDIGVSGPRRCHSRTSSEPPSFPLSSPHMTPTRNSLERKNPIESSKDETFTRAGSNLSNDELLSEETLLAQLKQHSIRKDKYLLAVETNLTKCQDDLNRFKRDMKKNEMVSKQESEQYSTRITNLENELEKEKQEKVKTRKELGKLLGELGKKHMENHDLSEENNSLKNQLKAKSSN
ncbi:uncharacterized protein L201_003909 [Kwoniella dendrophila CBS 6074]|uniref:Uncharacterized protein n=1 Tax=Kwoniella dendrophila CBS 6074 TaxID=1295534 RepID=A0AAX4JWJ5_9TREE